MKKNKRLEAFLANENIFTKEGLKVIKEVMIDMLNNDIDSGEEYNELITINSKLLLLFNLKQMNLQFEEFFKEQKKGKKS